MGRGRVSAAPPSDHYGQRSKARRKKAAPGLRVIERAGYWHITGTARAGGRSQIVRKSSGLAATLENKDAAEAIRLKVEQDFREQIVHGRHPSIPLAPAAEQFLTRLDKRFGVRDQVIIQEITAKFGLRLLNEIGDDDWNDFINRRMRKCAASTRERYLNTVMSFLNWCRGRGRRWLDELPAFERNTEIRKPKHRRARRVAEMTPALIELMIDNAAPHLAGQMAAFWATGGRVSSVLYHCRLCDYIAAEGREQLTYQHTKNGDPVVAAFHPEAAAIMRHYLEWRGRLWDREAPLFLTDERMPYADNDKAFGGQNKTAWKGMRRRTVKALRRQGGRTAWALRRRDRQRAMEIVAWTRDQCALVQQITPHWFRHHLATFMLSDGGDIRSAMEQGGWRNMDVLLGYAHDVSERRRAHVARMAQREPIDTSFARGISAKSK